MIELKLFEELDQRNRHVFSRLVESFLTHGMPVGSRTLARDLDMNVSPATVRNIMHDLELLGLLTSPHVSSGRVPTNLGLRLFVDELLEVGDIKPEEKEEFARLNLDNHPLSDTMDKVGTILSLLTNGASLVLMPKHEERVKQVDFVLLNENQALVVLVLADGTIENRVFTPPRGITQASLREAANYVNSFVNGESIIDLQVLIQEDISDRKFELDELAAELIEKGAAIWDRHPGYSDRLIVRGRAKLLEDDDKEVDFKQIKSLFDDLEKKKEIANILELIEGGQGVKIYIGSENKLFSMWGSTLVATPYINAEGKIIGAIGVIGPTRLNYGRVVPIVDYTAQLVSKLVAEQT
ncbi:MAG: heat-inducible transcriptional repressor HrcA [Rhodobacteraceae bacterium]|nr:heat-inducible transcriptional repressor HrcA [Paracoccaceae bacterium]